MAKFCFISRAQPGHLDFGGIGYLRTAVELKNRGHEVQWILSRNQRYDNFNHIHRAGSIVKGSDILTQEFDGLHTTASLKSEDLLVYAQNFARYLKANHYDCVVIGRFCVMAAFSAHMTKLPWATIGTDGREWTKKRLRSSVNQGVFPGSWDASPISSIVSRLCNNDFPRPSDKTFWATSPFLNISFFPRAYYQDKQDLEHPKHSHFVGCGTVQEPHDEQSYLLVTFGNSFDPILRSKLVKILRPLIRELSINVLFLAGNIDVANTIRQAFRHDSGVEVREWMPYDKAYRGAIGVVGHGGTSHIWYGLREGTPIFAVPFIADQFYGALQLERLNVGRTVVPLVVPWHLSRLLRKIGSQIPKKLNVYLDKRELSSKLNELLSDSKIRDSSIRLGRLMRTGGGVSASVKLIERLAGTRKAASTCVAPFCCC